MKKIRLQTLLHILLLVTWNNVYATWLGPVQVLSGGWGNGPTEFYVDWGDTPAYAVFPILYDVSGTGLVAISDESNGRVKIYSADGVLIRNTIPPVANPKRSSMRPKFIGQNVVIPINLYYFYSNTGALISQPGGPGKTYYRGERNGDLYVAEREPNERWLVYSADGVLLNTFQEKPLELGRITDDIIGFQGKKMHRFTITYPDKQWTIASTSSVICGEYNFFRDTTGNLYCAGNKRVVRYSACGKEVASFTIPDNKMTTLIKSPPGSGVEDIVQVDEGYGSIEMADNGDVYTSKVTPTNFSVIKWTWQASPADKVGGPDAPTDFVANVLGAEEIGRAHV